MTLNLTTYGLRIAPYNCHQLIEPKKILLFDNQLLDNWIFEILLKEIQKTEEYRFDKN